MLVHHHLIYQASTSINFGSDAQETLEKFLYDLVEHIDMEVLIRPSLAFTEGVNDAWTGLIGIVTSHISFHYWTKEQYVQLDIYSCKEFELEKTITFLNNFRGAKDHKGLWINRNTDEDFVVDTFESN